MHTLLVATALSATLLTTFAFAPHATGAATLRLRHPRPRATAAGGRVSPAVKEEVKALFQEATRELRAGRTADGEELLRRCLALDEQDAHSWLALARLQSKRGAPEDAKAIFSQGVDRCPASVHLLQAWGTHEAKTGHVDAARDLFRRGLKVDATNAYVHHAWGLLEARLGNADDARALFSEGLKARPSSQLYAALAEVETACGDAAAATRQYAKGAATLPKRESTALLMAWAKQQERAGDLAASADLLRRAAESAPGDARAHIALAQLELRRGDLAAAEAQLEGASALDMTNGALFNAWAKVELARGDVKAAVGRARDGCRRFPGDHTLRQLLGTLEERRGNFDLAREMYALSARLEPTAPTFVAWALMEEKAASAAARGGGGGAPGAATDGGGVDLLAPASKADALLAARALFAQGLGVDPSHGPLYNAYGSFEARCGNATGARAVFSAGAARCTDPSLDVVHAPDVWQGWGAFELQMDDGPAGRETARDLYARGIDGSTPRGDDVSFLLHSLGMLELSRRNTTAALAVFEQGLHRYPRSSQIALGAALAHSRAPNATDAARALFARAAESDPQHAHAWQAWGVFEARLKEYDTARALFTKGLRANPAHSALYQAYAALEWSLGNEARSRKLFQAGAAQCGEPPSVPLLQAWTCLEAKSGTFDTAKTIALRAIAADPGNGDSWVVLANLECRMGKTDKARLAFDKALLHADEPAFDQKFLGKVLTAYAAMEARQSNFVKARRLFQRSLEAEPDRAQTYHLFAEMEAKIGNIGALAELDAQARKADWKRT